MEDQQDLPLHTLQQFINEIDLGAGQLKAQDQGLASSFVGLPASSPIFTPALSQLAHLMPHWQGAGLALPLSYPQG